MAPGDIYLTTMVLGAGKLGPSDNILIADPSVCPRGKVFSAVFSGDRSVYSLGSKPDRADPAFEAEHCAPVAGSGKSGKEDYQLNLPHALPPRETGWQNWIT